MSDLSKLLAERTCDPRTLGPALDDATNKEWRDWLPETLRSWYPVETSDDVHDKVMAIQVVLTNPDVWEDWTLFVPVCAAFAHRGANFTELEPPTAAEVAWACVCMKALNKTDDFHGTTRKFILLTAVEDGLLVFPWAHLNLATEPTALGLVAQDAAAVELADTVQKVFDAIQDVPPDDLSHDELNPREAMLSRLFVIRSFVANGAKEAA